MLPFTYICFHETNIDAATMPCMRSLTNLFFSLVVRKGNVGYNVGRHVRDLFRRTNRQHLHSLRATILNILQFDEQHRALDRLDCIARAKLSPPQLTSIVFESAHFLCKRFVLWNCVVTVISEMLCPNTPVRKLSMFILRMTTVFLQHLFCNCKRWSRSIDDLIFRVFVLN